MRTAFVILAACLIAGCEGENVPASAPASKSAKARDLKEAPDFNLLSIDGGDIRLSSFKGKVVIVDFWATWCGPCVKEIPGFINLKNTYGDKGFEIIGISVDSDKSAFVNFARERGINYPIVYADDAVQSSYGGIRGIPTTFFIDREGRIAEKIVGAYGEDYFIRRVSELLAQEVENE